MAAFSFEATLFLRAFFCRNNAVSVFCVFFCRNRVVLLKEMVGTTVEHVPLGLCHWDLLGILSIYILYVFIVRVVSASLAGERPNKPSRSMGSRRRRATVFSYQVSDLSVFRFSKSLVGQSYNQPIHLKFVP